MHVAFGCYSSMLPNVIQQIRLKKKKDNEEHWMYKYVIYVSRYQKRISPNMILDKSETVLYHFFYVENCLEFLCDDLLV